MMASVLVNKKVRSLVMVRWCVFRRVLLKRGMKTWSFCRWKGRHLNYKQNDKSCAYPLTFKMHVQLKYA